jgi:hypothetical protein
MGSRENKMQAGLYCRKGMEEREQEETEGIEK